MLSNLSQYSPQGLMPQFPGLQTAGLPQITQGAFGQGQPSPYNGHGQFGHEAGQTGLNQPFPFVSQPFPFGGQINPLLQNPFSPGQFSASPFAPNPYQQSPWLQNPGAFNPQQSSFGSPPGVNIPVQQIVPVLAQLAQQIAVQSAVAQQIGVAVHQLAHQLATQGLQGYPGAGQALAAAQPFIGYAGFNPQQAQAWGAGRPQTIQ